MNRGLTYKQTMDKVEHFMEQSDIRRFCEKICKGDCCLHGCWESEDACRINEGRRLTCSAYICSELRRLLFNDKDVQQALYEMQNQIANHAVNFHVDKREYFRPPINIKDMKKRFRIGKRHLAVLDGFDTSKYEELRVRLDALQTIVGKVRRDRDQAGA